MSTVRMCDFQTPEGPCGVIFSERERNWSTGHVTFINDDGDPVSESVDFCPDHTATKRDGGALPRFRATVPTPSLTAGNDVHTEAS